uniref:E3 SUMO-protein ligase NSE2 n=1 Tax=Drosophila rhopaloa TaxID=1041015 RepID=A0A6P4FBQ3_DRORH
MDFNHYVDGALTSLLDSAKFLKEISDSVSDLGGGDEIRNLVEENASSRVEQAEKIIELKTKHKGHLEAMQQAKDESATVEEFERIWEERRDALDRKPIDVKSAAEYQSFKRAVESTLAQPEVNETDDDDVVPMELPGVNVFSPYDPWTKALIKNPVRNKVCGHIYDRDYVHSLIKDNIGIRCPVAGCANRAYINPGHLIEDAQIRHKMRQVMNQIAKVDIDEVSSDDEESK